MFSTHKKGQPNRRLLSQLDGFDQDIVIGNAASERQKTLWSKKILMTMILPLVPLAITNENTVNVKILERCFNESFDSELSNFVDTKENRI